MGTATVRLNEDFISTAKVAAKANKRSVSKQVEYWAEIGRITENNRDLPFEVVKSILKANAEVENGQYTPMFTQEDWESFIEDTYGSFQGFPLKRERQGT